MSYKIQKLNRFTISDLRKLEKKGKQASCQRRIAAVRMVMEGYTMVDVAHILGMHRQSVASYVKKFKENAIEGLLTRKQIPGKKPYLIRKQQEELKELILNTTPAELQYGQESFWNTRNIQYVIKEKFLICMSREGIRKMLHRMNFSYTNATYVLKKTNKEKQIQFQTQLDVIKKT
ncbi:winged helix-turn-helix domain-containing protein [Bacillus sp. SRB3LM]|uniref:helix-turn-helix domain-containing protein n=1 Tax=Bacillus sp. SRB3LM TaxID=2608689 RepID=UPI0018C44F2F|nr:winged helix-turn-helix domain-containing protein [Bacillus sp. SRB3LM]MBG0970652.1 transposase [Bacillus sp. SRB3LM]MBG0972007.1 transposase [Bacillus sp. SRB3LM]